MSMLDVVEVLGSTPEPETIETGFKYKRRPVKAFLSTAVSVTAFCYATAKVHEAVSKRSFTSALQSLGALGIGLIGAATAIENNGMSIGVGSTSDKQ